jgi:protein-tyrosine phosphatase
VIIDCNEIIPDRLWVGRLIRPEDVKILIQKGITHVVSLQSDEDLSAYGISLKKLLKAYEEARIELRRVATRDFDMEALEKNLAQCIAELESALEPRWARVYLHCTAGINRSPTVAAAYLMRSHHISAQEAFNYLSSRRHCSPYLALLEKYSESLKGAM